jgi:hypothetical protein
MSIGPSVQPPKTDLTADMAEHLRRAETHMTAGTCRISLIVVRPWAKVQELLELLPALTNVVMASSDQVGQVGRF